MSRQTSRGEATVGQLRRAFGVSRQAWHAAKKRAAAPPKPRAPRRRVVHRDWLSDDEAVPLIVRLVEQHPAWGVPKVWANLRHLQGHIIGKRRVHRLMKELGLLLPAARKQPRRKDRGHVAVADSNRRWATDMTTTWTSQDGVVAIFPVIDCGDRSVLDIEVDKAQDAPATLLPVARALFTNFGAAEAVPADLELLTDHGPQYTGRDCDDLCDRWGVDHRFSGVGRPTGNAIAERVILTLKTELIWTRDWRDVTELRDAVRDWMKTYNHGRTHQSLGHRTPAQQRAINLQKRARLAA
jgi:putative transposase